ncbi:MAG: hypothetical protein NTX17_07685 [Candidatus Eisenbacteria bacterium]|nr:hypothetical protein [Candidatus Eisenbacteria bacterium]
MNGSKKMALLFVTMLLLIIAAGGVLIYWFNTKTGADPEVMMGIMVVVAIATLMTVLFILAAGFSSMRLADPKQALGLPEGSIRSMIALVLIMVFIIFGIFLFRKVSVSNMNYLGFVTDTADVRIPEDEPVLFTARYENNDKGESTRTGYYVYVPEQISDEGKRLAQQLITTVGTLVVAIASFYFGSTLPSSAAKKEREEVSAAPMIQDITPREGAQGKELGLEIEGTGFKSPRAVRLLRGGEAMVGTEVLSNATKIQCKVLIDKEPGGKWDINVENEDGTTARLAAVFAITQT